jgi:hypothetical protein
MLLKLHLQEIFNHLLSRAGSGEVRPGSSFIESEEVEVIFLPY